MSGRIFGILGKTQVGLSLQCHWLHLWSFWQVTGVVVAVQLPRSTLEKTHRSGWPYLAINNKDRLENQPAERSTLFPGIQPICHRYGPTGPINGVKTPADQHAEQ